jgi:hypothetical protein
MEIPRLSLNPKNKADVISILQQQAKVDAGTANWVAPGALPTGSRVGGQPRPGPRTATVCAPPTSAFVRRGGGGERNG